MTSTIDRQTGFGYAHRLDLETEGRAAKIAAEYDLRHAPPAVPDHIDPVKNHGELRLEVLGYAPNGAVLMQIWRGERKASVVDAPTMMHFIPADFTKSGAAHIIQWMVDIATALETCETEAELRGGLAALEWKI